jgi:hypothetical protein
VRLHFRDRRRLRTSGVVPPHKAANQEGTAGANDGSPHEGWRPSHRGGCVGTGNNRRHSPELSPSGLAHRGGRHGRLAMCPPCPRQA